MCVRVCVYAYMLACGVCMRVRACVYTCVQCVRAGGRDCVIACVHACMHACVRDCVHMLLMLQCLCTKMAGLDCMLGNGYCCIGAQAGRAQEGTLTIIRGCIDPLGSTRMCVSRCEVEEGTQRYQRRRAEEEASLVKL